MFRLITFYLLYGNATANSSYRFFKASLATDKGEKGSLGTIHD